MAKLMLRNSESHFEWAVLSNTLLRELSCPRNKETGVSTHQVTPVIVLKDHSQIALIHSLVCSPAHMQAQQVSAAKRNLSGNESQALALGNQVGMY